MGIDEDESAKEEEQRDPSGLPRGREARVDILPLSFESSLNRHVCPSITFPFATLETSRYRAVVFEHWLGKSIPPPLSIIL
jgi:hypothetical protein